MIHIQPVEIDRDEIDIGLRSVQRLKQTLCIPGRTQQVGGFKQTLKLFCSNQSHIPSLTPPHHDDVTVLDRMIH